MRASQFDSMDELGGERGRHDQHAALVRDLLEAAPRRR